MTKVGRLFEEEKQEAVEQVKREMAKKMLEEHADISFVKKVTGLTDEEIKKLKPIH